MSKLVGLVQRSICFYLSLALIIIGVVTSLPVDVQAKMIEKKAATHQISKREQVVSSISVTELEEMRAGVHEDTKKGMGIVLLIVGALVLLVAVLPDE